MKDKNWQRTINTFHFVSGAIKRMMVPKEYNKNMYSMCTITMYSNDILFSYNLILYAEYFLSNIFNVSIADMIDISKLVGTQIKV